MWTYIKLNVWFCFCLYCRFVNIQKEINFIRVSYFISDLIFICIGVAIIYVLFLILFFIIFCFSLSICIYRYFFVIFFYDIFGLACLYSVFLLFYIKMTQIEIKIEYFYNLVVTLAKILWWDDCYYNKYIWIIKNNCNIFH